MIVSSGAPDSATATAPATAAAPLKPTSVLCVGIAVVMASSAAPCQSPGWISPTTETRIADPFVSPHNPVVVGSFPAFSAATPRRVLGPTYGEVSPPIRSYQPTIASA